MAFYELLNPVLNPLLNLGAFTTILIISIIVSLLTTLIYKYTTDQKKLKYLKGETKAYQEKLKNLKDKPDKALQVQSEMMKLNAEYMKASFKPMFFTIIPALLFLGWLGANLAFVPLMPDSPFDMNVSLINDTRVSLILPEGFSSEDNLTQPSLNKLVQFKNIIGVEGNHELILVNEVSGEKQQFELEISEDLSDSKNLILLKSPSFKNIVVEREKLLIFEDIPVLGVIPWIKTFGWLGAYILFSLLFSTLLRKWMKVV